MGGTSPPEESSWRKGNHSRPEGRDRCPLERCEVSPSFNLHRTPWPPPASCLELGSGTSIIRARGPELGEPGPRRAPGPRRSPRTGPGTGVNCAQVLTGPLQRRSQPCCQDSPRLLLPLVRSPPKSRGAMHPLQASVPLRPVVPPGSPTSGPLGLCPAGPSPGLRS